MREPGKRALPVIKSQRKSLTYNTGCSEEPEEEPVQDHGNVFPVLNNLKKIKLIYRVPVQLI